MYAKFSVLAVAALATLVAAKGESGGSGSGSGKGPGNGGGDGSKIRIEVGKGGIVFNPDTATAAIGDTVEFHFYPKNHSVTQGDFDSPCGTGSLTNGFFSGYVPSASEEAVSKSLSSLMNIAHRRSTAQCLPNYHRRHKPHLVLLQPRRALRQRNGWRHQSSGIWKLSCSVQGSGRRINHSHNASPGPRRLAGQQ